MSAVCVKPKKKYSAPALRPMDQAAALELLKAAAASGNQRAQLFLDFVETKRRESEEE